MKRTLGSIALLLTLAVVVAGCSASFSTANISNAVLAEDIAGDNYDPVDPTTTFPTDQALIHLVVTLKNAPSDTTVGVVWTAVDVGDAAPANTLIDQTEITVDGSGNLDFTLSQPDSGVWPVGTYKADIYLNGKLDRTLDYMVAES
jgi:hypothetical protein